MVYLVEISPVALESAKCYYRRIERDSSHHAIQWFNGLFDAIDSLERLPHRCSLAPDGQILGIEIYHYIYRKNFRILYTVDKRTVRIHHIRHTSQPLMTKDDFS